MEFKEAYEKWQHLGECVKDFNKANTGDCFDIRLAMLYDCWCAVEEQYKGNDLVNHGI